MEFRWVTFSGRVDNSIGIGDGYAVLQWRDGAEWQSVPVVSNHDICEHEWMLSAESYSLDIPRWRYCNKCGSAHNADEEILAGRLENAPPT